MTESEDSQETKFNADRPGICGEVISKLDISIQHYDNVQLLLQKQQKQTFILRCPLFFNYSN